MADNYAIEGMRSALAGYSADEEKIKELYAKARERLEAERVRAEKEIAAEAKAKRDAAAADALYSERNVDNALAARGLSFSGEAAQAKINSALGLNGRLKAIDEESAKAEAEANGEYSNDLHENDLNEIEKLLALRQKKASLRADFANAAAKAKSQGDKADEESEEEEKFTPPMTAGALAGKIIKSAGSETGMIANRTQNEKAKKILDSFAKRYDLSDEYYQALLFALEANGYAPDGTGYSRGGYKTGANGSGAIADKVKETIVKAKESFENDFKRLMDSYVFLGWTGKDLVEKATNAARKIEMNYIYSATETLDEFRKVCSHAGIPDGDVDEFIKELARNNPVKHGQRRKRSDGTAEIIY